MLVSVLFTKSATLTLSSRMPFACSLATSVETFCTSSFGHWALWNGIDWFSSILWKLQMVLQLKSGESFPAGLRRRAFGGPLVIQEVWGDEIFAHSNAKDILRNEWRMHRGFDIAEKHRRHCDHSHERISLFPHKKRLVLGMCQWCFVAVFVA